MIRACFIAVACWVAVGACGLPVTSSLRLGTAASSVDGFVTTPSAESTHVIESELHTGVVAADRTPASSSGRPGTWTRGWLVRCVSLARAAAWPHPDDTRVDSRMSAAAGRRVDLRREILRVRPDRRAGRVDAASEPLA